MTIRTALALGAVGALASGASAAFISFASDTNPAAPTFDATFDNFSQITTLEDRNPTMVDLLFDPDDDGPGGPVTVATALSAELNLVYSGTVQIIPGFFSHTFGVTGFFEYRDANSGALLVRGDISSGQAAFAGLGSSTTVFSGSMSGFSIDYTIGFDAKQYLGFAGDVLGDFSFTMTSMNGGAGAALMFEQNQVIGLGDFAAESSFSGSFVPAPGGAALIGLAGFIGLPRRRS